MSRPKNSKNKTPAMQHINMYVPVDVVKYFKSLKHPHGFSAAMRDALVKAVK